MDQILAGDGDLLLDCSSDLPMLLLLLLSLLTSSVLPPEPVVAPFAAASPDLSREGPFDAGQSASVSGAAPLVLDSLPGYWLNHMDRDEAVSAALQLQHDAGLMMTNLQVLGQFVTSLNWMSSEVMRLAFGQEQYPSAAIQAMSPSPRVRRAAHYMYMTAMGLWRPTGGPGAPGLLPISSCNNCMLCEDCFPKLD